MEQLVVISYRQRCHHDSAEDVPAEAGGGVSRSTTAEVHAQTVNALFNICRLTTACFLERIVTQSRAARAASGRSRSRGHTETRASKCAPSCCRLLCEMVMQSELCRSAMLTV